MAETSVQIPVTPFEFELDGCTVLLTEVVKACRRPECGLLYAQAIKCGNVITRVFLIYSKSRDEWFAKLKAEIARIKLMRKIYGDVLTAQFTGGEVIG